MGDRTIYIIGAGAIGKALAVFLQLEGRRVVLLRGRVSDGPAYVQHIRIVRKDGTECAADIQVNTIENFTVLDGIVVLTNKSYGNEGLARALKGKMAESPIVLLQNGLGVERPFIEQGFSAVYRCVLFVTSQVGSDGRVGFKPVAPCPIGKISGSGDDVSAGIAAALDSLFFRFRSETDIQPVIWKKAIVNSVFNSVCPLLETDNGIFHRDGKALEIAKRVIWECIAVARAQGVLLDAKEVTESLLLISRLSDGQLISTLQDIRQGRPTEIETLNFAIAEVARKLNMEESVKETLLIGELTKLKSELNKVTSR